MEATIKIGGINLLVIIIYTVIFQANFLNTFELYVLVIITHYIINLFASITYFSRHNNKLGRAYLLSSGLVLLIGFSTCFGKFN